jgi:ribosomal protein S3
MTQARCSSGVVGIKVSILPPDAEIHDKIVVDEKMKERIMESCFEEPEVKKVAKKKSTKKGAKK